MRGIPMKKTTAMMALLLIICAAVFFYGCTNKSSYSNSDDAYINYATDMQRLDMQLIIIHN